MCLLALAFVRLICSLHSTSTLPDARTGVRPAFLSKSTEVYKDSARAVKRPPIALPRTAFTLSGRRSCRGAPARHRRPCRVGSPPTKTVDNHRRAGGSANGPVDAYPPRHHSQRAPAPDGPSSTRPWLREARVSTRRSHINPYRSLINPRSRLIAPQPATHTASRFTLSGMS